MVIWFTELLQKSKIQTILENRIIKRLKSYRYQEKEFIRILNKTEFENICQKTSFILNKDLTRGKS